MFEKVLVANRGEIAVRIISAAKELGIRTVAVYSEADAGAMHVRHADESVCIGPAPARQSYLDIDAIVAAAKASGADAIHPGYGFLSENAGFAQAVEQAGLVFIGAPPEVIALAGDKVEARAAAVAAGVPVLPGSQTAIETIDEAAELAEQIGYPIAAKAIHGGGGRGLRVAENAAALEPAIEAARREADGAFGRSEVFLERFLVCPRHVEVQVVGDKHGNVIHLGDRDCTVQRRHQKMLEEAPAPNLPPELHESLCDAALTLARSIGYVGAGTVEFLVDPGTDTFYFLEMNARLQVEHGVTEMVTGIDLVETQFEVAAGQPLRFTQNEVTVRGHAIQARIAAEDPWNDFRPAPGKIDELSLPCGPWLRCDFGVEAEDTVQPHYDSMIGKLMALGRDRDAAIRRLGEALAEFRVGPIVSTAPYLADLLVEPDFLACHHHTRSVETDWLPDPERRPAPQGSRERKIEVSNHIVERLVRLPGKPARTIAIFGKSRPAEIAADRSPRGRSDVAESGQERTASQATGAVHSPMDGLLVTLRVNVGQEVREGEPLAILEAMKMEVLLPAPSDGIVKEINAAAGEPVRKGQHLITLG